MVCVTQTMAAKFEYGLLKLSSFKIQCPMFIIFLLVAEKLHCLESSPKTLNQSGD